MSFTRAFLNHAPQQISDSIVQNIENMVENIVPPLLISEQLKRVQESNLNYILNLHEALAEGSYLDHLADQLRIKLQIFEPRFSDFKINQTGEDAELNAVTFQIEGQYLEDGQVKYVTTTTTLSLSDRDAKTEKF